MESGLLFGDGRCSDVTTKDWKDPEIKMNRQWRGRTTLDERPGRCEYVHATVVDDLIGPGHILPRRPRSKSSQRGQKSTSKLLLKSGMEIHRPQRRGSYIIVEDVRHQKRSPADLVLVNKELFGYRHVADVVDVVAMQSLTPLVPPVDYDLLHERDSSGRAASVMDLCLHDGRWHSLNSSSVSSSPTLRKFKRVRVPSQSTTSSSSVAVWRPLTCSLISTSVGRNETDYRNSFKTRFMNRSTIKINRQSKWY